MNVIHLQRGSGGVQFLQETKPGSQPLGIFRLAGLKVKGNSEWKNTNRKKTKSKPTPHAQQPAIWTEEVYLHCICVKSLWLQWKTFNCRVTYRPVCMIRAVGNVSFIYHTTFHFYRWVAVITATQSQTCRIVGSLSATLQIQPHSLTP